MHSLEIKFSLVMSSSGDSGMVNGQTLPKNAMQHHDRYVVKCWCENKNSTNWSAQQS